MCLIVVMEKARVKVLRQRQIHKVQAMRLFCLPCTPNCSTMKIIFNDAPSSQYKQIWCWDEFSPNLFWQTAMLSVVIGFFFDRWSGRKVLWLLSCWLSWLIWVWWVIELGVINKDQSRFCVWIQPGITKPKWRPLKTTSWHFKFPPMKFCCLPFYLYN